MAAEVKKSVEEYMQESKALAKEKLTQIEGLSRTLFSSSDFTSFLRLVSRMPYFNYKNLLIIQSEYPEANCLAGFKSWKTRTGDAYPLKHNSKGIYLIAPFTNTISRGTYELTWYCVPFYDIQETIVTDFTPRKSIFIHDAKHLLFLSETVTDVLAHHFEHRVVFEQTSSDLISSGLPGRIMEDVVTVRKDLSEADAILWLAEAMCNLAIRDSVLSSTSRQLLLLSVCFCLYEIWGINHPGILAGSYAIIPVAEQELFLDELQQTVFHLYQLTASYYIAQREEDQILQDDFGFSYLFES